MLNRAEDYSHLEDNDPAAPWITDASYGGMRPDSARRSWEAAQARASLHVVEAEAPAFDDGTPPPAGPEDYGLPAEGIEPEIPVSALPTLSPFSAADLAGSPPPARRWLVRDRVPMCAHTLLSGDGAAGKTTILLQLCHAVALGRDWLGAVVEEPGPAVFLTGEEDRDELHRRMSAICGHFGTELRDLADVHLFSLPGEDVVMGTVARDGMVRPTPLFDRFESHVLRIRPKLIAVEAAADVFAGNESSRPEVRQFSQIMRRLAIKADAALVLVQHPSVAGLAEGNGRSGSTGWRNSFRAQLHFAAANASDDEPGAGDLRVLSVKKSNYGPANEQVTVRWARGVFVPEGSAPSLERLAAEADVDAAFVRCLDAKAAQGLDASPHPTSHSYAPKMFEGMPQSGGAKKRALAAAMERLLAAGKIVSKQVGSAAKSKTVLARSDGMEA